MRTAPHDTDTADPAPTTHPAPERPVVVLDTSAIMADACAHLAYPGSHVVVPLTVVDELGRNKARPDAAGRNAREFLRTLEQTRTTCGGTLSTPVDLPGDATLVVVHNGLRLDVLHAHHLDPAVADHRILAAALGHPGHVTLVSNDTALRLKAATLGLRATEHTSARTGTVAPHRTGYHTLPLSPAAITALKSRRPVPIADLPRADRQLLADVMDNEFVLVAGTAFSARRRGPALVKVSHHTRVWGLGARNKEQHLALDLLTDPDVALTVLRGPAGSGKTILAIAAGLDAVLEKGTHDRLLVLRPMIAVAHQDLGFLPGDVAEKTQPWFAPVVDTLLALQTDPQATYASCAQMLTEWINAAKVELAPITFLRGRSLRRTWIVIDEVQNLEASAMRTVISRVGEGSKLVVTGDDGQIDQPFVSALTCGLNATVDAFAGLDLFGHVYLPRGERSRLADLAAERL